MSLNAQEAVELSLKTAKTAAHVAENFYELGQEANGDSALRVMRESMRNTALMLYPRGLEDLRQRIPQEDLERIGVATAEDLWAYLMMEPQP